MTNEDTDDPWAENDFMDEDDCSEPETVLIEDSFTISCREEYVWLTGGDVSEERVSALNTWIQSQPWPGFVIYVFSASSQRDPLDPSHRLYPPAVGFHERTADAKLVRTDPTVDQRALMNEALAAVP